MLVFYFLAFLACMFFRPLLLPRLVARAQPLQHHHHQRQQRQQQQAARPLASAVSNTSMGLTYPPEIELKARTQQTASVIMLHGLGDTGHGWSEYGPILQAKLPYAKFIFPSAPTRPITLNMGMRMPGWFDIESLDELKGVSDTAGLQESVRYVESLVKKEGEAGVPSSRVVVMGFSQGGIITLLLLKSQLKLAGLVGLSACLPTLTESPLGDVNRDTRVLMCHGTADQVVPFSFGKRSADLIKAQGGNIAFLSFEGLGHGSSPAELADVQQFLERHLPETGRAGL